MGIGDNQTSERPQDLLLLRFTVPGKGRGKGRPRSKPGGGIPYTPKPTILYENLIKLQAQAAGAVVLEGPITLLVTVYVSIPQSVSRKRRADMLSGAEAPMRKPDNDNILKIVMDALNGIAWKDDVQCVVTALAKQWSDTPRVVVTLKRWVP